MAIRATLLAKRHLALIAIAGLWAVVSAPAQAGPICAGRGCATSASTAGETTQESVSRPVALNKFKKRAGSKNAIRTRIAAKRNARAAKAAQYSRVAARVTKAGKKFTVAAARPAASKAAPLSPAFANARAEMSDADIRVADASNDAPVIADKKEPEANVQLVAADQVNDIDRAASEAEAKPQPDTKPSSKPAPQTVMKSAPQDARAAVASNDSTWDQTSFIGKLFVAFGGLLTLASAARLFIA